METTIKAEHLGRDAETGIDRFRVTGRRGDRAVDAVLECETDGRDAWWDEETAPCETAGIDPGDEDTGWDDVLYAIDDVTPAIDD